jgi:hypothetical protein
VAQERDLWWTLVNNGSDPSGCMKGGEFLDYLSDY